MNARVVVILLAFSLAIVAVGFTACSTPADQQAGSGGGSAGDVTGGDGSGGETGTLRVLVTDKPYPFEFISEALVTITRVEARLAESDADEGTEGDDSTSSGDDEGEDGKSGPFVVLLDTERTFNLLELRNGRTNLLADAVVPAGNYTELRLIVTEGHVTLTDGSEFPLRVPSGAQTGIKLKLDFDVAAEEEIVLLLDIDMSRAFSAIPSGHIDDVETITGFRFSPSIAMRLIELAEAATFSGTVTDPDGNPLADVSITAFDGETEVTGTATDPDGTYTLTGLPTGTYRLEFTTPGYQEAELTDQAVEAGQTVEGADIALPPDAE